MPSIAARLRTTQNKLNILHTHLHITLERATRLGLHSTYTTALKRCIQHSDTTITSIANLANTLEREGHAFQP